MEEHPDPARVTQPTASRTNSNWNVIYAIFLSEGKPNNNDDNNNSNWK